MQAWLGERGASSAFSPVEVDNADQAALQQWQQELAQLTGAQPVAAWQPPSFGNWSLVRRELLNPGSRGQPVYLLGLRPQAPASWEAGDLVEILPLNGQPRIEAFLDGMALDAGAKVQVNGTGETLARPRLAASCRPVAIT